ATRYLNLIGLEARLHAEGTAGPALAGEAVADGDRERIALGLEPKLTAVAGGFAGCHGRESLEKEPHLDQVPELAIRTPDVLQTESLLDEAELAVQRDCRLVVGEHAQRQLVEPTSPSPVDRGGHEGRSHAASAPA